MQEFYFSTLLKRKKNWMMAALATIGLLWSSAASAQFSGLNQVTYDEPQTATNLTVNIAPTGSFVSADPNTVDRHFLVQMMGGYAASQDVLAVTNQGNGAGLIGVSGNTVSYGGVPIASFSNNAGYMDFTLNAAANPTSISALLRAITYTNTSQEPSVADRTMWVFYISIDVNSIDRSTSSSFIIKVNAGNDSPTIDPYGAISVTEDAAYTLTGVKAQDPEEGASPVTLRFTSAQGRFTATSSGSVTVSGNNTSILTLSGAYSDIRTYMANAATAVKYINTTGVNENIQIYTDDAGHTGAGGNKTASINVAVTVTATVNDAPTISAPASISVIEDTPTPITGISFADEDAGSASVTVTLSVGTGALSATTGGGVTVGGTPTARTLTGSIANINTFIAGSNVSYSPVTNSVGAQTLAVSINDDGNTGMTGGPKQAHTTVALNIQAVNDRPVVSAPTQTVIVNVAKALTGILLSDVDDDNVSNYIFRLTTTEGTFNIVTTQTGLSIGGGNTGTLTISGTLTGIQTYLNNGNVRYLTALNTASTSVSVTASLNDLGTSGSGGALTGTTNFTINIDNTNDAPVITASDLNTNEDVAVLLSGISFSDVDEITSSTVTLTSTTFGTFSATTVAGITLTGSGTNSMTISGTLANINSFISTVSFTPTANYSGNATVGISINDNGTAFANGAQTASRNITVAVAAVNDAPEVTIPSNPAVNEDSPFSFAGTSFSDMDAGNSSVTVTISAATGTMTGTSGGGVTVGGTTTARTLTGSITNINTYLAAGNLVYTPVANFNGAVNITVTINDNGNTGSGGPLTDSKIIALVVNAVNDAPVITSNTSYQVTEDQETAILPFSFSDADAGTGNVTVTLTVGAGVLKGITGGGVTVTGSNSDNLTLNGSIANINAYVTAGNVTYLPVANATTDVPFEISINDNGNSGGAAQSADVISVILITPVNDAPVITAPANASVDMNTTLTLNGASQVSVADVDNPTLPVRIRITATNGTVSLGTTSGITFITGAPGTNVVTLQFQATMANANNALASLSYTPTTNYYGPATVAVEADDLGNTGTGGAKTDTKNILINVVATQPMVTSVTSPKANGTYKAGEVIPVTLTFTLPVTVAGTPQLTLETGATDHVVDFTSVSGNTMTFNYTVQSGEASADLDYISTTALRLNGGSISNGAFQAILTLPAPGAANSLGANKALVIDAIAPTVTSVTVPANGTYVATQPLTFTVNFSEPVVVTGAPELEVLIGSSTVKALYTGGSNSSTLTFSYTVVTGNLDTDGIQLGALTGTITDVATNDANLTLNSVGSLTQVRVDAVAPAITSFSLPADKTYKAGETLDFTVTYSEDVIVTGTPSIGITIGSTNVQATYTGGTSNTLNFQYTVVAGNLDQNGITIATNIALNGGAIRDAAGNNAAIALTIPNTSGIRIDAVIPIVTVGQSFSVAENSAVGTAAGTVLGTDPGSTGTLRQWTITINADPNANGTNAFAIDPATGAITVADAADLDYEQNTSFTLTLTVNDLVNTSAPQTIIINVTNVPEPPTDIILSNNSIAENNALNANIGNLSATTPEAGITFTYSLVSGTGDAGNAAFTISGNQLQAAASFNYEAKNTYTIRIRATTNQGQTLEKVFTINITDVAEPPTDILLSSNAIAENNAVNANVGTLSATSIEPSVTFTYTLVSGAGDTDNGSFSISGNQLNANTAFDFETKNTYSIRVRATTNQGLTLEKTFTITVTDMAEPPTDIILSNASIFENNAIGALIGNLAATSQDAAATFTYSLVSGTGDADNSAFTISGSQLNAAAAYNYEAKNTYSIRVRATTNQGLTLDKVFTITIGDVNEAPTMNVIADQSLCATSSTYTIALTGVTPGPETAQTLTYNVTSNNAALFSSLTADAGGVHLRFVTAATGSATITVTLTDNGGTANGGVNTFSRSFNVGVTTIAAPTITPSTANPVSKGIDMTLTAAGGVSYVWDNAMDIVSGQNSATLAIRPSQNATYRVTAYNGAGCSATAEYSVTITEDYKVDATNFMSPNGDGINDRFVIKNIDSYPANELKIFDRSGRMIYTKKGYRNEWDARLNGRAVEEGTYYYILDFGPGLPKVKGFITVVRDK